MDAQLEDDIEAMINNAPQVSESMDQSEPVANHSTTHTTNKTCMQGRRKNDPGPGNRTAEKARSLANPFLYQPPPHFPI